jgi:hypothetical protein
MLAAVWLGQGSFQFQKLRPVLAGVRQRLEAAAEYSLRAASVPPLEVEDHCIR